MVVTVNKGNWKIGLEETITGSRELKYFGKGKFAFFIYLLSF